MKHLLLCLLLPSLIIAQHKPLSVGDKLPGELLATITSNLKPPTSNIKPQASNQLIILDFFATWCTACIKELPKLDSLQRKFKDQFHVILIAPESKEQLAAFRKKNKTFASVSFPVITQDSVFKKLFPYKFIPHEIWINELGKILAITDPLPVTAGNIQQVLAGNPLSLPVKKDAMDFTSKIPLLENGNGGTGEQLIWQTKFTSHLQGMGASAALIRENNKARWLLVNHTILFFYHRVFPVDQNRIILEVADSSRYLLPDPVTEEWKEKNMYSWEITAPANTAKESLQQYLLQDLNRYLGLNGKMEKIKMNCWSLVRIVSGDSLLKTRSVTSKFINNEMDGVRTFLSQPFSAVVRNLNSYNQPSPGKPIILDDTGITFDVDIEIPVTAYGNIGMLNHALKKYGLTILPVQREIDMFVLTELNQPKNKPL